MGSSTVPPLSPAGEIASGPPATTNGEESGNFASGIPSADEQANRTNQANQPTATASPEESPVIYRAEQTGYEDIDYRLAPRILASASAGLPLRLHRDREFGQGRLGPRYLDLAAHYFWLSHGRLQHGPGLGLAFNLSEDGGFYQPVERFSQWVVAPQYGAAWMFRDDLLLTTHLALPIAFAADRSVGVEVACGIIYKVLAGAGLFAELGGSAFGGAGGRINPMLTAEVGLAIDYEVLP